MPNAKTRQILLITVLIGALLSLMSLFVLEGRHAGGVLSGAAVGSVNFFLIARMVQRLIESETPPRGLVARFIAKYLFVGVAIAGLILALGVSPLGFALGFSNVPLGVVLGGLLPEKREKQGQ